MVNELEMAQIDEVLKEVDEMLDKCSKEKWRKYIHEEMERLGLKFVPDTEFSSDDLFDEEE